MKIVFIYPRWTGDYKGISSYFAKKAGGTYPPINLALLAAICIKEGHEAEIIDAEAEKLPPEEVAKLAVQKNPDFVALSGMSPFFHLSLEVAKLVKEENPNIMIGCGGQHVTIMEEKVFDNVFEYLFVGDGEEQWIKFLRAFDGELGFEDVPGIVYRKDGEIVKNKREVANKNLDIYPLPAYHLLPMHKYHLGTMRGRLPFTLIQTVRGCPWRCIFCASDQLDTTRIHKRSIPSIVSEIEYVKENYGITHISFADDVLTLDKKRTTELCNLLIEKNLKITFEGGTRANLVRDDLIGLMAKAGLIRLSFGLETVDEDMRKTMNKKVPLEAYANANKICNKHGVEALNSCMIGLPGESRENIKKTLDFLSVSKDVKQANFSIATPYPGTKLYEMAKNNEGIHLTIDDDFSQYKRYGQAVTEVGELSSDDLVELQNSCFVSVYSKYWRWMPVLKKNGVVGLLLTFVRLINLIIASMRSQLVYPKRHPSLE